MQTNDEFNYCRKPECFIRELLDKGYDTLWPLAVSRETRRGAFLWTFYVRWKPDYGSHVRGREICEKHTKILLGRWSKETQQGIEEEEATERWLRSKNSQILF